jgi:hypothetical protein
MKNDIKLTITIENKQDIELFEFANAMSALNNQYYSFLSEKNSKKNRQDQKLLIKKISHGSVIMDLVEQAAPLLPTITPTIFAFTDYLCNTISYFTGEVKDKPYKYGIFDLKNFRNLLELTSNCSGNKINFNINFGNQVIDKTFDSKDASSAQNKINKEIRKLQEIGDGTIKENVELNLYQARNSNFSNSNVGNIGVIAEISSRPKVLSFANDKIKYAITKQEDNPFNFAYNVDIEIKLKDETKDYSDDKNIKEYHILKHHGVINIEDLFDKKS